MQPFKSILQFQKHFDTDEKCRTYLELQRWGNTPCCPFCASINVTRLKVGKRFQCNEKQCRTKFSVTVKTVFENTKIPLTKWFFAMYILSNHSKGISSLQLADWLDVTQATAWFLNHRIREMLTDKGAEQLSGVVEVDECYIGGKNKNRHASKRVAKGRGGVDDKTMVFGAVERKGKVITKVIPNTTLDTLQNAVEEVVTPNTFMVSDEHSGYNGLFRKYIHETVQHSKGEYVRNKYIHVNTLEGFWNLLRKQIDGIHHSVSPKHLQRYCNEAGYRYNNKELTQDEKFANVLQQCEGRLKYNDLIANV